MASMIDAQGYVWNGTEDRSRFDKVSAKFKAEGFEAYEQINGFSIGGKFFSLDQAEAIAKCLSAL